jgi:hypothetical protein
MKLTASVRLLVVTLVWLAQLDSDAKTVTLLPSDINGGDTNTASFSNAHITLTPFIGSTQDTFNANATRLGIDNNGTNNNAFVDPDTDPNNDNDERLQFIFAADAGLSQIQWDFSRADGDAPSGINISGFIADPVATLSGAVTTSPPPVYDAGTGTLNFQMTGTDFGNPPGFVDLANPSASFGQTLWMRVVDTDQVAPQLAIESISYVVIPEPSALLLGGLAVLGLVRFERRK